MLHAFLSGQLRAHELADVDSHIDECAECQDVVVMFALGSDALAPGLAPEAATDQRDDERARLAQTLPSGIKPDLDDTRMAATVPGTSRDSPTGAVGRTGPGRTQGLLERGRSVGRYLVLDTLGQGAMGVVYAAYDPDLHRRVALKLVHPNALPGMRERMIREARAMARLTHINVVTIYEVGTIENAVYLAMELIEGETLREWLAREPRSWQEVRAVFAQIGAGLAAAHEVGLTHRDVKPDNVIVGADGRVRVTDFGLARADAPQADPSPPDNTHVDNSQADTIDDGQTEAETGRLGDPVTLTRTGTLLGTPAYMAPEQFARATADARTDQFGLCVALYEALYGIRPFAGTTLTELEQAVSSGEIAPPPTDTSVPRWLHEIAVRGLSVVPDDRYPDLNALLADLSHEPPPPVWRRPAVLAASVALVALVSMAFAATWLATRQPAQKEVCTSAQATAMAVWNEQRAAAMTDAFRASRASFASDSARALTAALNGWRSRWVTMHEQTCRATRVQGQQSERLLDVRMHCLSRKLDELDALVGRLADADPATVARADQTLGALPDIGECAQIESLTSLPPEPDDPDVRARLRALEREMAETKALIATGDYRAALSRADAHTRTADSLGYLPTMAAAELVRAAALVALGEFQAADRAVQRAAELAVQAPDDWAVAQSWIVRVSVAGGLGDYRRASLNAGLAEASVTRIGSPVELTTKVASSRGIVLYNLGEYAAAEEQLERALAQRTEHLGPDHPDVARSLTNLGNVARERGDLPAAYQLHERALAIDEAAFGPDHPSIGRHLHNMARILLLQGQRESALDHYQRALAIKRAAALGDDHHDVALTHNSLGLLFHEAGDLARAERHYRAAMSILATGQAAERALSTSNLGLLLLEAGRPAEALPLLNAARAQYLTLRGPEAGVVRSLDSTIAQARAQTEPRPATGKKRPPRRETDADGVTNLPEQKTRATYGAGQAWEQP